jgi:hypothetical protein
VDPVTRNAKLAAVSAAALLVVVAAAVGARLAWRARHPQAPPPAALALEAGEEPATPGLWIDVHSPGPLWKAARRSEWVEKAMGSPLGQGFAGSWTAFLATRGTDLAGAFEGKVVDLFTGRLLADPFRLVFLSGGAATGAPAVLVPKPSGSALSAYDLLEAAARSGSYRTARCPGADQELPEPLAVSRWLVADHAVFAGRLAGKMALARNPAAVVQALCAELPPMKADRGVDLSVTFARDALGREPQLGAALLGLGETATLGFGLEGERLVPRGIAGKLDQPRRLATAAPAPELLRLLPVESGLVLLATLNLPDSLDRQSLKEHLSGKYQGKLLPRTVALVWDPTPGPTQVALAWPERDARALKEAFTGPNRLVERRACGHVVLASSGALASAMERACGGKAPSILDGPGPVVAGLQAPTSLGLNVNAGLVLSRLLSDAWSAEHAKGPPAPEIEAARRLLEELPTFGLRGVARDGALAPGGFRS